MALGVPVLARGDHLRRYRRDPAQHHRPPAARPREGVSVDPEALQMLADSLRTTMTESSSANGFKLDAALSDLGWLDMLDEIPDLAIPLVFRLLGETGAHAPVLNDVVLRAAGRAGGGNLPLPFAGVTCAGWERTDQTTPTLAEQPINR